MGLSSSLLPAPTLSSSPPAQGQPSDTRQPSARAGNASILSTQETSVSPEISPQSVTSSEKPLLISPDLPLPGDLPLVPPGSQSHCLSFLAHVTATRFCGSRDCLMNGWHHSFPVHRSHPEGRMGIMGRGLDAALGHGRRLPGPVSGGDWGTQGHGCLLSSGPPGKGSPHDSHAGSSPGLCSPLTPGAGGPVWRSRAPSTHSDPAALSLCRSLVYGRGPPSPRILTNGPCGVSPTCLGAAEADAFCKPGGF